MHVADGEDKPKEASKLQVKQGALSDKDRREVPVVATVWKGLGKAGDVVASQQPAVLALAVILALLLTLIVLLLRYLLSAA